MPVYVEKGPAKIQHPKPKQAAHNPSKPAHIQYDKHPQASMTDDLPSPPKKSNILLRITLEEVGLCQLPHLPSPTAQQLMDLLPKP